MEGMMDGMKKQLVMMVPQMVIMGWINFFFQGFVASESGVLHVRSACKPIVASISQATFSPDFGLQVNASTRS